MLLAPSLQINFESAPRAKCVKRKAQNGEQNTTSGPVYFPSCDLFTYRSIEFLIQVTAEPNFSWIMIVLRQIWRVWGETVIQNRCSGNNLWIRISRSSAWEFANLNSLKSAISSFSLMTTHNRKLSLSVSIIIWSQIHKTLKAFNRRPITHISQVSEIPCDSVFTK